MTTETQWTVVAGWLLNGLVVACLLVALCIILAGIWSALTIILHSACDFVQPRWRKVKARLVRSSRERKHPFLKCERLGHDLEWRSIYRFVDAWDGQRKVHYTQQFCWRCSYKRTTDLHDNTVYTAPVP